MVDVARRLQLQQRLGRGLAAQQLVHRAPAALGVEEVPADDLVIHPHAHAQQRAPRQRQLQRRAQPLLDGPRIPQPAQCPAQQRVCQQLAVAGAAGAAALA